MAFKNPLNVFSTSLSSDDTGTGLDIWEDDGWTSPALKERLLDREHVLGAMVIVVGGQVQVIDGVSQ